MSIGCRRYNLEATVQLKRLRVDTDRRATFAGHSIQLWSSTRNMCNGLGKRRLRRICGNQALSCVIHRVDLRHAAGQVAEKSSPDLGVDAFTRRQKMSDFTNALAKTRSVLAH